MLTKVKSRRLHIGSIGVEEIEDGVIVNFAYPVLPLSETDLFVLVTPSGRQISIYSERVNGGALAVAASVITPGAVLHPRFKVTPISATAIKIEIAEHQLERLRGHALH